MIFSFLSLVMRLPGAQRMAQVPRQLAGISPFDGDSQPTRVRLVQWGAKRPTFPFPHPWNYDQPINIMEAYFCGAERETGAGRHNRYLEVPGFAPVLVTRDPAIIRAIATETGERPGQFDRDTLPSTGIARATGPDTLLYANGALWKHQRKLAASPFGKTTLFQPERFHEFAEQFRQTIAQRLQTLRDYLRQTGQRSVEVALEPEIKAVMLEMLTNCFFGTELTYAEIRERYVPALERTIDHIVRDTALGSWRLTLLVRPPAQVSSDAAAYDELTDRVLAARQSERGLWKQFKSDAPSEALRSNIKVFLAGALEATTSFACWAISHLARNLPVQERVFQEVQPIESYTPENLAGASYLGHVLDETLRLTPSLYFLPRRATADTWVETADGRRMFIPQGTHILLDVWHANRSEEHWGVGATGFPASDFAPERWANLASQGRGSKEMLHFGFGHGPRVCPGKHLGQLEVALVVGALVKLFRFRAVRADNPVKAGVSTKPLDGTLLELELR